MNKILVSILSVFLITSCQISNIAENSESAWKFRTGEEDWGPTVYISQSNTNNTSVSILSERRSFKPTMLLSPFKNEYGTNASVELLVDTKSLGSYNASLSEYFGEFEIVDIGENVVKALKYGRVLDIKIDGRQTESFNLEGSESAVGSFLANFNL